MSVCVMASDGPNSDVGAGEGRRRKGSGAARSVGGPTYGAEAQQRTVAASGSARQRSVGPTQVTCVVPMCNTPVIIATTLTHSLGVPPDLLTSSSLCVWAPGSRGCPPRSCSSTSASRRPATRVRVGVGARVGAHRGKHCSRLRECGGPVWAPAAVQGGGALFLFSALIPQHTPHSHTHTPRASHSLHSCLAGVWTKDMRIRTNLAQPQITKILKVGVPASRGTLVYVSVCVYVWNESTRQRSDTWAMHQISCSR